MHIASTFKTSLRFLLRLVRFLLLLSTTFVCIIIIGAVSAYFYFARGLPNFKAIEDYTPPVISTVYSSDGTQIGEFWTECRELADIRDIPPIIIEAVLAAEDARFFEHKGIDFKGIIRATIVNIKAGHIVQGGSTITQQLTRSLLLSRRRTFERKIKEAILAIRLERHLTKEQILAIYLNQIYFGNRSYGIKAAARNYFHKQLDEINLAEAALLAGLPKAPSEYSPINNPNKARQRQLLVLRQMKEHGSISEQEWTSAVKQKLTIYRARTDKEYNLAFAPYFTEYIRQKVQERYGSDALYRKGLKIYTTLDLKLQQAAQAAVRSGIEALDRRQGYRGVIGHVEPHRIKEEALKYQQELERKAADEAFIFPKIDTKAAAKPFRFEEGKTYKAIVTGFSSTTTKVLVGKMQGIIPQKHIAWARPFDVEKPGYEDVQYVKDPKRLFKVGDIIHVRYLGGRKFALFQIPKVQGALLAMEPNTGFIRAMVGGYDFSKSEFNRTTQALRQAGSLWKPIVYAAALDKGYTFETTVIDSPIVYITPQGETWKPKNYAEKFVGDTTFLNAIVHSRNVPTVKIAKDIGTHYITAYARKLGITTPIDKYLSMALGANGTYLNEMVNAYAVFANYGIKPSPVYILRIEDSDGNILEEYTPNPQTNARTSVDVNNKLPETLKDIEVSADKLNTELIRSQQATIINDHLKLTNQEILILYGSTIPPKHVITPQTAYLMTVMLENVVLHGTGWRIKELGRPVAGKTGTTNDETDAWFIGYTPQLVAGVWVGFDNMKPIGKHEAGGRTAAPIFLHFMSEASKEWEIQNFKPPAGIKEEDIPYLVGGSCPAEMRPSIDELKAKGKVPQKGKGSPVDFFDEDF